MLKKFLKILENKKEIIFEIFAIILIILFAVSISPKTLQNDTFYTIAIGKLITENGIDMQDHFSWQDNLPYTYPHWLYDLGMYNIYNIGGWDGIYISTCVLAAILGICIYKANSRLSKNPLISFFVTLGSLYILKGYIAARAQLVTFILFILLVYNIEKFIQNRKIINAIVILIIQVLMANLHVAVWPFSFVLYLPYIAEYLICEIIDLVLYRKTKRCVLKLKIKRLNKKIIEIQKEKKELPKNVNNIEFLQEKLLTYRAELKQIEQKNEKIKQKREEKQKNPYKVIMKKNNNVRWLIVLMIIALFTGLITPLGNVPYTYTYLTIKGNSMENINEHLPLTLVNNIPVMCAIIIFLIFLIFTEAKITLSDLFMICGLTYLMFATRRQSSMFALIGSLVLTRLVTQFCMKCNYSLNDIIKKCFTRFTALVTIILVLIICVHFEKDKKDKTYINTSSYPVKASEWILNNLDVKNIRLFNEYNYGSYLLFKGIPVFIDSRCDLYTPEFNSKTNRAEDGRDIFADYLNASNNATYYGKIFDKYKITHVILYKNNKIDKLIKNADSNKYINLYEDNKFVIYEYLGKK